MEKSSRGDSGGSLEDHIDQNIEAVVALQRREWERVSPSQRRLERVSRFVGRPMYLVFLLGLVSLWMGFNWKARLLGLTPFDPPPFAWLDTLVTIVALFTTTVVLVAQNRQYKLEQQRAHLDLQVNLLTEQKVTKVIHLLEELRRDMPNVADRHDPQAAVLQQGANAAQMISALSEGGATADGHKPAD